MAWKDASEITVAGDGQVYIAPVGTALPANESSALNAAFVGLGYHNEDGVTFTFDPDVAEINAWQTTSPVRREITARNMQFAFALMQWNEENVPFAFGGGAVVDLGSNHYRFDFPAPEDSLDERAVVVDVQDGSTKHRWAFYKGSVTESVESQFRRANEALLPITFKVLAPDGGGSPGMFLSNGGGFAAGS